MMLSLVIAMIIAVLTVSNAFQTTVSSKYTNFRKMNSMKMINFEKQSINAIKAATGILSILSATMINITPANAYGNAFEVVDPKTAVVNEETYKSDSVKSGIDGLKGLIDIVGNLKADLLKDSQLDAAKIIKADLNTAKIRNVLNKYNDAFSEDTQRGTDRLIRNVIQDITELDRETVLKPGKARADTKTALILKRLSATEASLKDLAAFYPK